MKRMTVQLPACLALLLAGGGDASAQVATRKTLTLAGARQVIDAATAAARTAGAPGGVIAVVDDGGNLMALERIDGTFPAGALVSYGKARTAALFRKPTAAFEKVIGEGRTAMVALSDFTPLQGGVPVVLQGEVVGAVGVSGAASAAQDEQLALAGAMALSDPGKSSAVNFFGSDEVAAAFAQGKPLIEVDGYKVHASRRDTPGQAEVHLRDTDILYVLGGSATLVTGGTVVEGKSISSEEIRGVAIKDGERRLLVTGDVMVVPSGVPHWFQEVRGPLTYYVVKARS